MFLLKKSWRWKIRLGLWLFYRIDRWFKLEEVGVFSVMDQQGGSKYILIYNLLVPGRERKIRVLMRVGFDFVEFLDLVGKLRKKVTVTERLLFCEDFIHTIKDHRILKPTDYTHLGIRFAFI